VSNLPNIKKWRGGEIFRSAFLRKGDLGGYWDLINLKPVEVWEDYEAIVKLKVRDTQKDYVSSNLEAFAKAFACQEVYDEKPIVLGVYKDKTLVGVAMFCRSTVENRHIYYFLHFMIDENYQGKGYGKDALIHVVELIKTTKPLGEADWIYISVHKESVARRLYCNTGFEELNEYNNEIDLRMPI